MSKLIWHTRVQLILSLVCVCVLVCLPLKSKNLLLILLCILKSAWQWALVIIDNIPGRGENDGFYWFSDSWQDEYFKRNCDLKGSLKCGDKGNIALANLLHQLHFITISRSNAPFWNTSSQSFKLYVGMGRRRENEATHITQAPSGTLQGQIIHSFVFTGDSRWSRNIFSKPETALKHIPLELEPLDWYCLYL